MSEQKYLLWLLLVIPCVAIAFGLSFANPELTQTQLLFKFWYVYGILAIVIIAAAVWVQREAGNDD